MTTPEGCKTGLGEPTWRITLFSPQQGGWTEADDLALAGRTAGGVRRRMHRDQADRIHKSRNSRALGCRPGKSHGHGPPTAWRPLRADPLRKTVDRPIDRARRTRDPRHRHLRGGTRPADFPLTQRRKPCGPWFQSTQRRKPCGPSPHPRRSPLPPPVLPPMPHLTQRREPCGPWFQLTRRRKPCGPSPHPRRSPPPPPVLPPFPRLPLRRERFGPSPHPRRSPLPPPVLPPFPRLPLRREPFGPSPPPPPVTPTLNAHTANSFSGC